jgi:predicted chitinase
MPKNNEFDAIIITETGILDSNNANDTNSILYNAVSSQNNFTFQNQNITESSSKAESVCLCEQDMTEELFIDLLHYLRKETHFDSYKNAFFFQGSEYVSELRVPILGNKPSKEDKELTANMSQIVAYVSELNKIFKKFKLDTCLRRIHFLAQSYAETSWLTSTIELGLSETNTPSNYKGGFKFIGRGMKQITHDYNYLEYYDYVNSTYFYSIYISNKEGNDGVGEFIEHFDINKLKQKVANNPKDKTSKNKLDTIQKVFGTTEKNQLKSKMLLLYTELENSTHNLAEDVFHSFNSAGWYVGVKDNSKGLGIFDTDDIVAITKFVNGKNTNDVGRREKFTNIIKQFYKYTNKCN